MISGECILSEEVTVLFSVLVLNDISLVINYIYTL